MVCLDSPFLNRCHGRTSCRQVHGARRGKNTDLRFSGQLLTVRGVRFMTPDVMDCGYWLWLLPDSEFCRLGPARRAPARKSGR